MRAAGCESRAILTHIRRHAEDPRGQSDHSFVHGGEGGGIQAVVSRVFTAHAVLIATNVAPCEAARAGAASVVCDVVPAASGDGGQAVFPTVEVLNHTSLPRKNHLESNLASQHKRRGNQQSHNSQRRC